MIKVSNIGLSDIAKEFISKYSYIVFNKKKDSPKYVNNSVSNIRKFIKNPYSFTLHELFGLDQLNFFKFIFEDDLSSINLISEEFLKSGDNILYLLKDSVQIMQKKSTQFKGSSEGLSTLFEQKIKELEEVKKTQEVSYSEEEEEQVEFPSEKTDVETTALKDDAQINSFNEENKDKWYVSAGNTKLEIFSPEVPFYGPFSSLEEATFFCSESRFEK